MDQGKRSSAAVWTHDWMLISALVLTIFVSIPLAQAEISTATDAPVSPDQFQSAMESALAGHRDELSELRARMDELEKTGLRLLEQIQIYDSELTSQQQMLLMSKIAIEEIERAIRNNRAAVRKLSQLMEIMQAQYDGASRLFVKTSDHIQLLSEQMSALMRAKVSETQEQKLEETANALIHVFNEKKALGKRYHKTYEDLSGRLKSNLEKNKALSETLTVRLEGELDRWFYTPSNTYQQLFSKAFIDSLTAFGKRINIFFKHATWKAQWDQTKMGGIQRWAVFVLWVSAVFWCHVHLKARLKRFETDHPGPQWRCRRLGIFLLRRSILFIGMTIVFGIYDRMALPLLDIGLSRVMFLIFMMLLITRWGLDYFKYPPEEAATALRAFVSLNLKRLLRLLRVMIVGLILFIWLAGRDSLLTFLTREMLIAFVFAWTVLFWRRFRRFLEENALQGASGPRWLGLLSGWSYLVSGGGILLSLAGYKIMAGYWIASWIKTVSILFWGWISLKAIREWQRDHQESPAALDITHFPSSSYQLRWAFLQLGLAVWLLAMALGLIWAWDNGSLMSRVRTAFTETFTIGSLSFSMRDIVLAGIILFVTRLIVKVGRTLIHKKVMVNGTLEPGLKDSISSILSYCIWGLGLLMAMATLGVNATSLAVVFGALGVGIGFGLQTIFNNFFSGLILLFERPIQVGDTIEINGIWAEVKKINVRATVVQTFDNASVIIPNSEFISQKVTNWSFKDKRMRRNLEIGVAYGSDIDLVERTLLEIASEFPGVLKYPHPEVLFTDHGDSALIFRLRIWVQVDDYWAVPSRIRFEIDKRFRERGIEIAFPQRDIHIRDIPEALARFASTSNLQSRRPGKGDEKQGVMKGD